MAVSLHTWRGSKALMLGHLKDLGVTNCLQTRQPQENMDYNLSPQVQKNHLTSDPPASKKQVLICSFFVFFFFYTLSSCEKLSITCLEACLGGTWLAFGQRLSLMPTPVLGVSGKEYWLEGRLSITTVLPGYLSHLV